MKRADIKAGQVYGYTEERAHIYRYEPVLVLSTDLYMIPRYGDRTLVPADKLHTTMKTGSSSYDNAVGLLCVRLYSMDTVDVAKVCQQATPEAAVAGINGAGRDVNDPDNHDRRLAVYMLLTNQRYLHGDYRELTDKLEAGKRQRQEYADAAESNRKARLATYRALAARLEALGITGYDAADWASKSRFEELSFEDMATLLDLAERGREHDLCTHSIMS